MVAFPGGQRLCRSDGVFLQTQPVVGVRWLAVLQIQTPTSETSGLSQNHSVSPVFHFRGYGVRPVLRVYESVFRHPDHAFKYIERCPPSHQIRSADQSRVQSIQSPIIQRKHVVLNRFRKEEGLQLGNQSPPPDRGGWR